MRKGRLRWVGEQTWDFSARFGARNNPVIGILPSFTVVLDLPLALSFIDWYLSCALSVISRSLSLLTILFNSQSGICPYHKLTILVLEVFSYESSLSSLCLILARSRLACSRLGFASPWEHTNNIFQKVIFTILIRHILSHSWYTLFISIFYLQPQDRLCETLSSCCNG